MATRRNGAPTHSSKSDPPALPTIRIPIPPIHELATITKSQRVGEEPTSTGGIRAADCATDFFPSSLRHDFRSPPRNQRQANHQPRTLTHSNSDNPKPDDPAPEVLRERQPEEGGGSEYGSESEGQRGGEAGGKGAKGGSEEKRDELDRAGEDGGQDYCGATGLTLGRRGLAEVLAKEELWGLNGSD